MDKLAQLSDLATQVDALVASDVSSFQRRARILQSLWRLQQGLPCGIHSGRNGDRKLGSRLVMPDAQNELSNYLSENIRNVVRTELAQASIAKEKLYSEPRIYNDLLSSQPLCFNLFGELSIDLDLASAVISAMTEGRFERVTAIEFEHSPGRSDPKYLADRSAFDVFIKCINHAGSTGFIGIEVKYHENLIGPPSTHKTRYEDVARMMECFPDDIGELKKSPIQQIWRDHLLAGVTKQADGYSDALTVILYPRENGHVSSAVDEYSSHLKNTASFTSWTLEDFVETLRKYSNSEWVRIFYDRYLDFEKIRDL